MLAGLHCYVMSVGQLANFGRQISRGAPNIEHPIGRLALRFAYKKPIGLACSTELSSRCAVIRKPILLDSGISRSFTAMNQSLPSHAAKSKSKSAEVIIK